MLLEPWPEISLCQGEDELQHCDYLVDAKSCIRTTDLAVLPYRLLLRISFERTT